MGIQEILSREDGRSIRIYKRGLFWVAYEQSALLLCTRKALQLRSEQVKAVGAEVVSVGFPEQTRVFFCEALGSFIPSDERSGYWELGPEAGETDFGALRQQYLRVPPLPGKAVGTALPAPAAERVLGKIRAFPLAEKTPLEAMMFIKDLQALLQAAEKQAADGHV